MRKRILKLTDIENEYAKEGSTIKSVAEYFQTNDRKITEILKQSTNDVVRNKQDRVNQHRTKYEICKTSNCNRRVYSKNLCKMHYNEIKLFGKILSLYDKRCCTCNKESNSNIRLNDKYYCLRHKGQIYKYGKILERTIYDRNDYNILDSHIEILIHKNNKTYTVKISNESFETLRDFKFCLRKDGYVSFKDKDGSDQLLHRFLMNYPECQVDHINRDKLDNRLENLRYATWSQNQINKSIMKTNTSGVVGVTWDKSRDKWKAQLNINNKAINIGRFNNFDDAVDARLKAEKIYHKEFTPIERKQTWKM